MQSVSSEEDLGRGIDDEGEDDNGGNEEEEGFPAEGMFSGAHPANDSSNGGMADDDIDNDNDEELDLGDGESGERGREGRLAVPAAQTPGDRVDGTNDGSSQSSIRSNGPPAVDADVDAEWDRGSEAGSLAAEELCHTAAAPAATPPFETQTEDDEDEREGQEEREREGFDADAAAAAAAMATSSSSRMVWDGAAAGDGRISEGGVGSVFSYPGRGSEGGGESWPPRRTFGLDGGDGGSTLIAPSDIMRHIPAVCGRDREAQAVIDALQEVYRKSLKPIEELSMFDKFHHDVMTDADLAAKPQVLLLGQHSSGKTSMIRHFIGRDFPGMHIGPEAGPEMFQVVTSGSAERTIKGSALCMLDELPYSGLGKFGASFLGKFQASIAPSPPLEHINFVDTPGILAAGKHGPPRGYPFPEVVRWFADRSDLILLIFDAHKLDMGEEFREVVNAIAHHGDRVRVVLNKAQDVDSDRLLKVYGALMWSVGRCFGGKTAAPRVYVGSFWDGPRRHPDDRSEDEDDSFELDEIALHREMMDLPKNVGVRKIDDLMQRAKLVKIHLEIVYAVRARVPRLWGAEAAQDRILASLEEVFEEVKTKGDVQLADMPDVEEYRRGLGRIDFRDLPRRNRRLLSTLDDVVEKDIKQCVTKAGGVRRIYKLDSAARVMDDVLPSTTGNSCRRRRSTVGGERLRTPHHLAAGLFDRRSFSIFEDDTESSRGSDEVDGSVTVQGEEQEEQGEDDMPSYLGACVMVVVVLVGIFLALWKMEGLPFLPEWSAPLQPDL